MPVQSYPQLLNWGPPWQTIGAGSALSTATTATLSPQSGGADYTIPASLLYVGMLLVVEAAGFLTSTASSTTATIFLTAGSGPTTLATPSGITTPASAITGFQWRWRSLSRITALASSGNTISTQGRLELAAVTTPALPGAPQAMTGAGMVALPAPNASGETAAAVNTLANMAIMLRGTLAGANATIQCTQFVVAADTV